MAAMDEIKALAPDFSVGGIFQFITYAILFALFLGITSAIVFWIIYKLRFNKKIVLFEEVDGRFQPTKKYRGMFISLKNRGDVVLYIRGLNRHEPRPKIQTGKNTFWYFVSDNGELINFGPGDFNSDRLEMGANMTPIEMMYAKTSLDDFFKERYDKPKFWDKYGGIIVNIAVIAILMIFLYLIVMKLVDVVSAVAGLVEKIGPLLDKQADIAIAISNSGGTGYVPAT